MKNPGRNRRRISVHVKPGAKHQEISLLPSGDFRVAVHEPSREGKANQAVLTAIADYFSISRSRVKIVTGKSSRNKIIEIF